MKRLKPISEIRRDVELGDLVRLLLIGKKEDTDRALEYIESEGQ